MHMRAMMRCWWCWVLCFHDSVVLADVQQVYAPFDTDIILSDGVDAPTNLQVSLLQTTFSISPTSENQRHGSHSALVDISASPKNKHNATIAMSTQALHSHMGRIVALSLIISLVIVAWLWLVVTCSYCPYDDTGQPLAAASTAPKSQERIYYLDNIKLFALVTVYFQHGFASFQPPWYENLATTVWYMYSMGTFTFCSGAVSSSCPSAARCQSILTGLVLPCILFQVLDVLALSSAPPSLTALIGGHWTPQPWYLKALVYWRIALFMLGNLPDWALVVVSLIVQVSYCTGSTFRLFPPIVLGQSFLYNRPLMEKVVQYTPYFTMGHILVKRHNLLRAYISWLKTHPTFRISCLALHAALYADALSGYGCVQGLQTYPKRHLHPDLYGCLSKTLQIPYYVVGMVLATAWLPTGRLPVLSLAGANTLQGYIFNPYVGKVWNLSLTTILPLFSDKSMWWLLQFFSWPVICVFACSEPVRFILWPFTQPTWSMKNWMTMTLEDVCDVPLVLRVGFYRWLVVEVLVLSCLCCVRPWIPIPSVTHGILDVVLKAACSWTSDPRFCMQ